MTFRGSAVVAVSVLVLAALPSAPASSVAACEGVAAARTDFVRLSTADLLADAANGTARLTHHGKTYEVPVEPVTVEGNFTDGVETKAWREVLPIHYAGENKTTEVRALLVGTKESLVIMFSSWHGMVLATPALSIASTAAGECYLIGGAAPSAHNMGLPAEVPETAAAAPTLCVPSRGEVCVPSCANGIHQAGGTVALCGQEVEPCPDGIGVAPARDAAVCGQTLHPCRRDPCVQALECLEKEPSEDEGCVPVPDCLAWQNTDGGAPSEVCGHPVPHCTASVREPCGMDPCQGICDRSCVQALGSMVGSPVRDESGDDTPVDDCTGNCPSGNSDCCPVTDKALNNCCDESGSGCCNGTLPPLPFGLPVKLPIPIPRTCGGCDGPLTRLRALGTVCESGDPCDSGCNLNLHTYGDARFCTLYHDGFQWAYMMGVGAAITQDVWDATGLNTRFFQNGDCGKWNPTTHVATTDWLDSTTCGATVDRSAEDFETQIMKDATGKYYDDAPNHLFFLYMAPTDPGWCGGGAFCPGNKAHGDMRIGYDRGYGTPDPRDYDLHNRQAVDLAFVLAHELGHTVWGTHDPCPVGVNPRNEDHPGFEPPTPQADWFAGNDDCTELEPTPATPLSYACYDMMGRRPVGLDDTRTLPRYSDGVHNETPALSNKYYMQCEIAWKVTGKGEYHTADGCAQMHGVSTAFSPDLP